MHGVISGYASRIARSIEPFFSSCLEISLQERIYGISDLKVTNLAVWQQAFRNKHFHLAQLPYTSYAYAEIPGSNEMVPIYIFIFITVSDLIHS